MVEEVMSVPGDRDTVGTDAGPERARTAVSRKVMPVLFAGGLIGGFSIAALLILSAHALIWPDTKTPEQKAGTARTVSEQQAMSQDSAFRALNGGLASPQPGQPGAARRDGQPLRPGQPIDTYGQPGAPAGASPAVPQLTQRQQLALAARRAPIMGFAGGMGSGISSAAAPQAQYMASSDTGGGFATPGPLVGGQGGPQAAGAMPEGPADITSRIPRSPIEVARATIIGDRNFLIAAGRTIPCTLQTAINSTQAGIVSCVIGQDIYSENGRVIMLDKGTKVLGQYAGSVKQGQARLFVVWTRALTPRGVAIDLGSPASDELGRAGIGGGVDTQFWTRFGSALMFSVLEDLATVGSSHFAGYGTNTTQVPAQTSSAALADSQNIDPILKANQGQTVAIQVARDYDFGQVYDVRIKTPGRR